MVCLLPAEQRKPGHKSATAFFSHFILTQNNFPQNRVLFSLHGPIECMTPEFDDEKSIL